MTSTSSKGNPSLRLALPSRERDLPALLAGRRPASLSPSGSGLQSSCCRFVCIAASVAPGTGPVAGGLEPVAPSSDPSCDPAAPSSLCPLLQEQGSRGPLPLGLPPELRQARLHHLKGPYRNPVHRTLTCAYINNS